MISKLVSDISFRNVLKIITGSYIGNKILIKNNKNVILAIAIGLSTYLNKKNLNKNYLNKNYLNKKNLNIKNLNIKNYKINSSLYYILGFSMTKPFFRDLFVIYFLLQKYFPKMRKKHILSLYTFVGVLIYITGFSRPDYLQKKFYDFLRINLQLKTKKQITELYNNLLNRNNNKQLCYIFHPNNSNCIIHIKNTFINCVTDFTPLFTGLYLTSRIFSNKKLFDKELLFSVLQSSIFLASAFTTSQISGCLYANISNFLIRKNIIKPSSAKVTPIKLGIIYVSIGFTILLEKSKRQRNVSLFYLANILYPIVSNFKIWPLMAACL